MITIVRFIDPLQVRVPITFCRCKYSDAWVCAVNGRLPTFTCHCDCHFGRLVTWNFIQELTLHTLAAPTVEHYPDGKARNGYLTFEDGTQFNLDNVADYRVIPCGGEQPVKAEPTYMLNLGDVSAWLEDLESVTKAGGKRWDAGNCGMMRAEIIPWALHDRKGRQGPQGHRRPS